MEGWIRFWTAVWIGSSKLSRHTVRWLCNARGEPPSAPKKGQPEAAKGEPEGASGEQPPEPKKTATKEPADAEGSALLRWVGLAIVLGVAKFTPYTTVAATVAAAAWVVTALALGYLATTKPKPEPKTQSTDKDDDQEQPEEPPEPDQHPSELLPLGHVAVLLNEAYTEGSGVHLAHLADRLTRTPLMGLPATRWETRHVRALLAHHKVRVRDGVRVPPKGGREGVHKEDFPPLPPAGAVPPVVGVVVPGQPNNNNAGNAPAPPYRITDDPDNPARHHVHHERA
ncbi:hypothetical protein SFUL_3700 [Streptomyces microflavus DSM 40593]|uniref:Uncharacterized protein n=1 Tax=Streptomyces microflavus DSM 40593 TaxID=1303692 RepID=N0CYH6_STRMI|nr:hypothetical protein [Streptomyces microflavus]AGK78618.1 hypothetical protein SFUL_3700 [Streptomyces microflavus DSM 40593]